ncbi:MAG: right-handed parallel beta-helix repeat-containing protein [Solirubrobacterales bacterium]
MNVPRGGLAYLVAFAALIAAGAAAALISWGDDPDEASAPMGSSNLVCDVVAKPGGSVDDFVAALAPQQTACLRDGVHRSEDDIAISARGVTLSSYPGERATLEGRLWIREGGDAVTIENLTLNGRNTRGLPSPTVNGDAVRFRGNDVTNDHTAICFVLGDDDYGDAVGTVIERNRIHDCGRLPATNHDHGIYVAHADRTVIRGNWIYSNADRGVQLYPDADGSVITGNVIDGNGQGILFSGEDGEVSEDNLVEDNVITNSNLRFNVESFWPDGREGTGNLVRSNCVFGGARSLESGGVQSPAIGFEAIDNVHADPLFVDREAADLRLAEDSRCPDLIR